MKTIEKRISELKTADYNPRRMTEKQEKDLTDSIKQFGFVDPLVVNSHPKRKNIVIGGHQRLIIAKKLKLKTVPCVEIPLDIDKERELNIRLNKNNGEWDVKKLQEFFDVDQLIGWGFTKKELEFDVPSLVDKTKPSKKVRSNVEVSFQLGEIRFMLPQSLYIKWIDALAKKIGMKKEVQVEEIKKRLLIPVKVK
jgi:hypothetical protein